MKLPGRIIGVDESGKGDFFGPLVVAGVLAGEDGLSFFDDLGVRDSKRLSDGRCRSIAERIRARFPYLVLVLMPEAYNRRYDKIRNLNILLAECHARVISEVSGQSLTRKKPVDLAVSDKFGKTDRLESALAKLNCKLPLKQIVGGEVVPQVAAASILARAEFVRQIEQLSRDHGVQLPKGASAHVDEVGRSLVEEKGVEVLAKVAKLHFKNYRRVVAGRLFSK